MRKDWLRALADPRVGASLRHIHGSVDHQTSLADLAHVAGTSRTAFAARFKELRHRNDAALKELARVYGRDALGAQCRALSSSRLLDGDGPRLALRVRVLEGGTTAAADVSIER